LPSLPLALGRKGTEKLSLLDGMPTLYLLPSRSALRRRRSRASKRLASRDDHGGLERADGWVDDHGFALRLLGSKNPRLPI